MSHVLKVAKAAVHYLQAAYAALSKSMQFEWSFLQRVIPNCSASFLCLRDQIIFWPTILDNDVSASELSLFTSRAHLGEMGINDPIDSAGIAFSTSRTCTKKILDGIKGHAKKQQKVALNASIMTSSEWG